MKASSAFNVPENEKSPNGPFLYLSAERMLPISNLLPLSELEINRLEKAISPHKITPPENETPTEILGRDLASITDFLNYVEAEPYTATEKAENRKRLAFKKGK